MWQLSNHLFWMTGTLYSSQPTFFFWTKHNINIHLVYITFEAFMASIFLWFDEVAVANMHSLSHRWCYYIHFGKDLKVSQFWPTDVGPLVSCEASVTIYNLFIFHWYSWRAIHSGMQKMKEECKINAMAQKFDSATASNCQCIFHQSVWKSCTTGITVNNKNSERENKEKRDNVRIPTHASFSTFHLRFIDYPLGSIILF